MQDTHRHHLSHHHHTCVTSSHMCIYVTSSSRVSSQSSPSQAGSTSRICVKYMGHRLSFTCHIITHVCHIITNVCHIITNVCHIITHVCHIITHLCGFASSTWGTVCHSPPSLRCEERYRRLDGPGPAALCRIPSLPRHTRSTMTSGSAGCRTYVT